MRSEAIDQVSARADMGGSLLEAKLSVPLPGRGLVSRGGLIDAARSSGRRVVGVTAPAGYGKSTFLTEWASLEDRRVAWATLDRFDDDPAALLGVLAAAYARVTPDNASLVADMGGVGTSALGRAAPRLASVFRSSPAPFVLMLDDLHEVRAPACHDVLEVVVSGIPRGSQLVAASRSEQAHLPRLRAAGDAWELGTGDLALDADGTAQIFSGADVRLGPGLAQEVAQRTEGWPVGVYLASLIARDSRGEALTISGDDRYVADYLYREALSQLPQSTQRFLRRTAVLDQLSAPLCEAVVGEPGAQAQLRALEASSLFVVPLDRRREWYRYHALFQEFLLGELRRVEPAVTAELHLRAADWYEANGSPALALEHLLNTGEQERCVQLVTSLVLSTFHAGQISTVERWLTALGDLAIEDHPPLAVLAGWIAAMTGRVVEADRWLKILDCATYDVVPGDGSASFASARAMLRAFLCPAGPEQMMADASLAVDQEPPWSPFRDTALCLSGEAHLLSGDVDRATALFAEAIAVVAINDDRDSLDSEAELAIVAMDRGRWTEAAEHVETVLAIIDSRRMHDYATSVLAFAGAARLAVHRGDLKEARRQLTQAMRARPSCTLATPYLAVRVRLQLAKVHWALGDQTTARHLLREIDDILLERPALGALVEEVAMFRQTITAAGKHATTGGSPLTAAELRLLPYLQTHLTIREIAERLYVSRNTVNSEVGSIYRKLEVSSRNEAVEHATALGLLGG